MTLYSQYKKEVLEGVKMTEEDQQEQVGKLYGFSHYAGRSLYKVIGTIKDIATLATLVGAVAYGGMSCAYGPYDAGKVIYAKFSGDKSLKHRHIEEAKCLFSRRLHKSELDERNIKNLYLEFGVVPSEGKKPTEDDVSWYRLLDWMEDND